MGNELALFSGIGGGILGGQLLGWRTVCAVENDAYRAAVLAQRQNDGILPVFPIWSDVRTFDGRPWNGIVDIVSGGFPCQAFSTAARGRNCAPNLWPEMLRIIGEVQPRIIFSENVDEKSILCAQRDLAESGYATLRANVSASDLGADHIRSRWWLLAYTDGDGEFLSEVYEKMERMSPFYNDFWQTEPDKFRVVDGNSHRVDRIRSLGEGQVPLVAAETFRRMIIYSVEGKY